MMLNKTRKISRFMQISLITTGLFISGCNNDTGSSKLPGNDSHDHGSETINVKKIGTPLRVSQVAGHHDVKQLAAFATGNKKLYLVTPEKNLYVDFDWSDGSDATRSQHSFDGHGEHFLVLDTNGKLHILETAENSADWSYKGGVQVVSAASITAGAKLTVSAAEDKAFITDPDPAHAAGSSKIQVVDLEAGNLLTAIDLAFPVANAGIAWTGAAAEHEHGAASSTASHPGRLIVASSSDARAHVYDLDSETFLDDFALDYAPTAIYSSPGYRYAVIAQRPAAAAHQVQFVDSGLYAASANAPALLGYKLLGTTPAHYRSVDGIAALFFDGGSGPRFSLFSDASLAGGGVLASENSLAAHHGIAEPRGDVVLASKADRSGVLVYHRHDDHFHEEGTVDEECQGLHGGGSNAAWSGFGCNDGVLVVGLAEEHAH